MCGVWWLFLLLHISVTEHSASSCFFPQLLFWFVAFKSLTPHVHHNGEISHSMSQPHFLPLPLGFVTLTTGRGSAGAECGALGLTVIINNLEPQKWAMRLLDTLSGLKRSDAFCISVAWIYHLVSVILCFAYPIHSVRISLLTMSLVEQCWRNPCLLAETPCCHAFTP